MTKVKQRDICGCVDLKFYDFFCYEDPTVVPVCDCDSPGVLLHSQEFNLAGDVTNGVNTDFEQIIEGSNNLWLENQYMIVESGTTASVHPFWKPDTTAQCGTGLAGFNLAPDDGNTGARIYYMDIPVEEGKCYKLSATYMNAQPIGSNLILPDISLWVDGVEQVNTGPIPEDETWYQPDLVWTATMTGVVEFSLRSNAIGNNGNDLYIDCLKIWECPFESVPCLTGRVLKQYDCESGYIDNTEVYLDVGDNIIDPTTVVMCTSC